MTLDISTFTPMLKEYYTPKRVDLITYKNQPTLRLLKKRTDWTGNKYIMPIWHESAQAVGHDFTGSHAAKGAGLYEAWELERSKIYGFAQLDRLAMKAATGDARSFMKAYTAEVDGILQLMGQEVGHKIFRDRNSTRGVVGALAFSTDTTVTLTNRQDIVHFHVGMPIVASTGGTAAGIAETTFRTIATVNRAAGSFTVAGVDLTAIYAVGDTLHRATDLVVGGTGGTATDNLGLAGFDAWCPSSAPGATSFFGVDRSVDTDKLGGIRVSCSGYTIEDALIEMAMRAFESGAKLDHFCMNPLRFGYLIREAGSKLVRDESTSQKIGVTAFKVQTPAGEQTVYADPNCQADIIWGFDLNAIELVSTGSLPEIADDDLKMLRDSASDSYEVRMAGYGQLGVHVPGHIVRGSL